MIYTGPERIVSGGQTGADRGGLDAAIELGLDHGGWCPAGRRAEDGYIPYCYSLRETKLADYKQRTRLNVLDGCATLIFSKGTKLSGGTALTRRICSELGKPYTVVNVEEAMLHGMPGNVGFARAVKHAQYWLFTARKPRVLNVAGSRESKVPGIQEIARRILVEVLSDR